VAWVSVGETAEVGEQWQGDLIGPGYASNYGKRKGQPTPTWQQLDRHPPEQLKAMKDRLAHPWKLGIEAIGDRGSRMHLLIRSGGVPLPRPDRMASAI